MHIANAFPSTVKWLKKLVYTTLEKKICFLFKIKGALRFATAAKDAVHNALFWRKTTSILKTSKPFFVFQKML